MNGGDRIILVPGLIQPGYLGGVRGTFIRRQPGEDRSLVRLDKNPKAKRYAGGEWCVPNSTIRLDDTDHPVFGTLIRDQIDPSCRASAQRWMEDIAQLVDRTASEFIARHGQPDSEAMDLTKYALLWRFYWHLSNELRLIAEGHEQIVFNRLIEQEGKP